MLNENRFLATFSYHGKRPTGFPWSPHKQRWHTTVERESTSDLQFSTTPIHQEAQRVFGPYQLLP